MTLEERFKKETGFDAYVDNQMQPKVYQEYYVEWLEELLEKNTEDNPTDKK